MTESALKPIFDVRNKIIHELAINFAATNRNRNGRARNAMMKHTDKLLQIGEALVDGVDQRLNEAT